MAEEVGFEPTDGRPSPVFKTGAFSRSATPPQQCDAYYPCPSPCKSPLRLFAHLLGYLAHKTGKTSANRAFQADGLT